MAIYYFGKLIQGEPPAQTTISRLYAVGTRIIFAKGDSQAVNITVAFS